jgi:anaerobic magnesium-protoporphyrin IX monomethyl ester cyclase
VHPTYHNQAILSEHPEVDIIVRGEGEATVLELIRALAAATTASEGPPDDENTPGSTSTTPSIRCDLSSVPGIAWRCADDGGTPSAVMTTRVSRTPIADLDAHPIGWQLITNWDQYQAFGLGRAAVVQFSRGCPHTCTYCGQWMFWRHWRHRDVTKFVDELAWLYEQHQVRFFWLADENPTTLKDVWQQVLQEIADRRLPISMCASIRAQDIVRDADILPLYKQAGFVYVLMGVETVTDATLSKIRKGSHVDDAYQAVRLLRQNHIMSIVDYIFGLEDETPRTLWRGLRGLLRYDGDFVNALYLTPHAWTPLGHQLADEPMVETDIWKWDYRHQVLAVKHLTPLQLFIGVKLVEVVYHLHPRRLWRILAAPDRGLRHQLRFSLWHTTAVFLEEVWEQVGGRLRRRASTPSTQ